MYTKIKKFLTSNTSAHQTVIKNTFWLLLAEGVSKGLNIILMFWLAKLISVELFGEWNVINAVIGIATVVIDLGLQQIYIRDILKSKNNIVQHLIHSTLLKFILLICMLGLVYILSIYVPSFSFLQGPLLVYMLYMGLYNINEFLRSAFRAQEKMESEAVIKIASGAVLALVIGYTYIVYDPLDLMTVTTGYLVSIVVQVCMTLWFLHYTKILQFRDWLDSSIHGGMIRTIALSGLYLGLTQLCMYAYFQIDQVILHHMGYTHEVGIYSAMRRIVQLLFFVGNTFIYAYMPHYLQHHDTTSKSNALMRIVLIFWGAVIVTFGLAGKWLIGVMYTSEYIGGYWILMIMMLSLLPMLLVMSRQQELLSDHREKTMVPIFLGGLICNIVLNIILIPSMGVTGALIAAGSTQVLVWIRMQYVR